MRHLWSLIAGVVIAPVVWGSLALGRGESAATFEKWAQSDTIYTGDLIKPAAYLVAAGVLLGLIGTLRFSPLGAVFAGVLFILPTVGALIDPGTVGDILPDEIKVAGQEIVPMDPVVNGTLLFAGALMLVAAASAQRWRHWPAAAPVGADVSGTPTDVLVGQGAATDPTATGDQGGADPNTWGRTEAVTVPVSPAQPSSLPPGASTGASGPARHAMTEQQAAPPASSPQTSTEPPTVVSSASARSAPPASSGSAPSASSGLAASPPQWPPADPDRTESVSDSPWAAPPRPSRDG